MKCKITGVECSEYPSVCGSKENLMKMKHVPALGQRSRTRSYLV